MGITKWNGDEIKKKYTDACKAGINQTMNETCFLTKQNHPGWKNRTGLAEGSIGIIEFAKEESHQVIGRYGSKGCVYFVWLELNHGSALRNQADFVIKNRLVFNIKAALAGTKFA